MKCDVAYHPARRQGSAFGKAPHGDRAKAALNMHPNGGVLLGHREWKIQDQDGLAPQTAVHNNTEKCDCEARALPAWLREPHWDQRLGRARVSSLKNQ